MHQSWGPTGSGRLFSFIEIWVARWVLSPGPVTFIYNISSTSNNISLRSWCSHRWTNSGSRYELDCGKGRSGRWLELSIRLNCGIMSMSCMPKVTGSDNYRSFLDKLRKGKCVMESYVMGLTGFECTVEMCHGTCICDIILHLVVIIWAQSCQIFFFF